MKIKFLLLLILLLIISLVILYSPKKYFFQKGLKEILFTSGADNVLLLGKPGSGYYGADNTDSMILASIQKDKLFLIYIPRDLIIKDGQKLYKINSLAELNKQNTLFREIEKITGLSVDNYIEYDLYFVKNLVNSIGGIDVYLKKPIIDAVSGFALNAGKQHLNGEWVEFVIRSRYAWEGDFFRMGNQAEIIKALRQKIQSLPKEDVLKLIQVFRVNKSHYQTNLNQLEILEFLARVEKVSPSQIKEIIPDFNTGLWSDGNFKIALNGYGGTAYGLIPKEGIDQYFMIQKFIKESQAQ